MAGIVSKVAAEVDALGPPNALVSKVVAEVDDNTSIMRVSTVVAEVDVLSIPSPRRPVTVGERNLMRARERAYHMRIEVMNGSGTWVDLTTVGGFDWVDTARWGAHIDQPTGSATITLKREAGDKSLSPFLAGSTLNRLDDGTTFSSLLDVARRIRIYTATVAARAPRPANGNAAWKEVFRGKIDRVNFESDPITLTCRDHGAFLLDAFIELERVYGAELGTLVEGEMQEIINDTMGVGLYTLVTPVSPGWMIRLYTQAQVHVLEAVRTLAMQIGWDVRYMWNATDDFELRFFSPDREKTEPDDEFGPDEYFNVSNLTISDDDIRNVVKVVYVDAETQTVQSVTVQNDDSIARYGRRYMEIVEGSTSNINSLSEATALANAALSDLSLPGADHSIETSYYWPATLGDLYRHLANGVHYDEAQTYAVVSYDHFAEGGDIKTTLVTRGKPAGAYRSWFKVEARPSPGTGGTTDVQVPLPPPIALISEITTADPINNVTLQYSATRPQGFNGALEYRRTILNDPDGQTGDDTGWLALPDAGVSETIERGVGRTRFVRLQIRWTANPETTAMAEYAISPKRSSAVVGEYEVVRDGGVAETADSNWETGGSAAATAGTFTQSWSEAFGVVNNLTNGGVGSTFNKDVANKYDIRARFRLQATGGGGLGNHAVAELYVYASVAGGAYTYVGMLSQETVIGARDTGEKQVSGTVTIVATPGQSISIRLAPRVIAYGTSGDGYQATATVYVNHATPANRDVRWDYATAGTTLARRGVKFGAEAAQPGFSITPHAPGTAPTRTQMAEGEGFWQGGLVLSDEHDLWTQKRKRLGFVDVDEIFNSTSFVDSTLSFPVYAGEKICIELDATFSAGTGTGGVRVRLGGTATFSAITQQMRGSAGTTQGVQSEYFTTGAPANGYVNYAGIGWVRGRFYVEVLTDGNAVIQVQTITGGDSYTLREGSTARMERAA